MSHIVVIGRGAAAPYRAHPAWKTVGQVLIDRKVEEAEERFGSRIAGLHGDIVVDMISFELEGAQQLVEALRGKIEHYLFCSSIWVYGHPVSVPTTEVERPNAIDTYGLNKAKIEDWLLPSRLGEMNFPQQVSGRVTSLAKAGCPSTPRRTQIPTFSLRWPVVKS